MAGSWRRGWDWCRGNIRAGLSRPGLGYAKRGDTYLRTLLIHGARSVIRAAEGRENIDPRLKRLLARRHKNIAAVAWANRNARIVRALLAHGREYEVNYQVACA